MILRTVTLHVRPGYEDRFYIQTAEVADWANTVPGIDYARVVRVVEPDCRQTEVFVSEWQDAAALYAWNAKPETAGRGPLNDGGEVYWDDAMVALWEVMGEPLDVAVRGWAGLDLFPGFGG